MLRDVLALQQVPPVPDVVLSVRGMVVQIVEILHAQPQAHIGERRLPTLLREDVWSRLQMTGRAVLSGELATLFDPALPPGVLSRPAPIQAPR